MPGKRDYNHFGAAKDLPGLRGQRHWRSVCCLQSKYSDPAGVNNILLREGKEVPGNRGYKYFGAAKDLQGVRGHRMTNIGDPYFVDGQNIQIRPDLQLCVNESLFREGKEVPGNRGYKYFGAAKDLPGVRELFDTDAAPSGKKTRAELMKDRYIILITVSFLFTRPFLLKIYNKNQG